jgi:chitodextrinase
LLALFAASMAQTAAAAIGFVQVNSAIPTSVSTVTAAYSSAQTAGDMNVVIIGWSNTSNTVTSVTDSKGNSYKLAVNYVSSSLGVAQSIYYASNIAAAAAGANTVTVKLSASTAYPDLRILEYSGVNTLDKTASASGTATTASSGSATTTQASELLVGANYTWGYTSAAGSGYTSRVITGDGSIAEDRTVSSTGSYSATASMSSSDNWAMQMATFYSSSASCAAAPSAPTGLAASGTTSSSTNLSWNAVTPPANCTITSYKVLQNGTSIGTTSSTSYAVTGLSPSTTYTFTVEATDSYGTSAASSPLNVTTPAASCAAAPSAPTGLASSGTTSSSTNLSWNAVTPPANCTITSYKVLQNGTSIGTTSSTSYAVTGLSPSTTYTFTVEATDSYGTSAASSPVNVTTPASGGATYYVSPTGSDSANGSQSTPWLTIQHAASTVTAGATVYVEGGTYHQSVNFTTSGTATAPITFESYPGQTAIIDGSSGVTCCGSSGLLGLINIQSALSYVTIEGFTVRNFTTSNENYMPVGILYEGSGTGVQILNNIVYNITTTAGANGNAGGIMIYGTSQTPITQLVVSGNEVYDLQTGQSESMTFAGNVTHFQATNNLIHDNYNIGLDLAGYWGHGPVGYDQPMYGEVSGNTIYNISGIVSAGEGDNYNADGIYCDGCAYVTIERNVIMQADYGVEVDSECQVCQSNGTEWTGANDTGTAATSDYPCYGEYVTVRNNIVQNSNATGMSIGGYAAMTSGQANQNGGGSTFHAAFVNNTLYNNATQPQGNGGGQTGEFEMQYQLGSSQDNYFENNIVYAGTYNVWLYNYVAATGSYTGAPATFNWNLYDSVEGFVKGTSILWRDASSYTSFSNWQSSSGEDANSLNINPEFESLTSTPPDLYTLTSSPAVGAGGTSLACSAGWCDPNGNSPNSIYGSTDFLGNPRTINSKIDIGAYENTGASIYNTVTATLTAGLTTLSSGQSTTLTATVTAIPGGYGAPSGTVNFMLGTTLLSTQTLLPTSATTTAASMPISASQLAVGSNTLTAVYSGNTIATACCSASSPPGGGTQVAIYPSETSAALIITVE